MKPDALRGSVLAGRYEIGECIGAGGMAWVYRARHVTTGRPLAVKIIRPDRTSEEFRRRFVAEVQFLAALKHEHIVEIVDANVEERECFLVMPLLDGEDLGALLRREGRLSWSLVRGWMLQLCDALRHAHERGIVHRDLKPSNCFLVGPERRLMVLDLGIAKLMSPATGEAITVQGEIIGTLGYMAPEQVMSGISDARSDVYSAGVVMFHLLTGRLPFQGSPPEIVHLQSNEAPPTLSSAATDVPYSTALERLLARALATAPEDRFSDMNDLSCAIRDCDRVIHVQFPARRQWTMWVLWPLYLAVSTVLSTLGTCQVNEA